MVQNEIGNHNEVVVALDTGEWTHTQELTRDTHTHIHTNWYLSISIYDPQKNGPIHNVLVTERKENLNS